MSRWPVVALGEVLTLALHPERVEPHRSYPSLGVYGFGRGVITDKAAVKGSDISASVLFKVEGGQFIYSRLKAFEGAFAVVPEGLNGRYVSHEFPTFDCDTDRLDRAFLAWLFRLPATWATLAAESTGVGARRERLHPDHALRFRLALPPLPEQRRLAAKLDAVAERIAARSRARATIEAELNATMTIAFDRISADAPRRPMGEVAPLVRRPVAIDREAAYQEVGARAYGRGLFNKPLLPGSALTWQKLFRIEQNDLVFSNIKAWEGAFAVAGLDHHGKVGSHRYLTCVADLNVMSPTFLAYFLHHPAGMEQVQAASPGSADRNRTLSTAKLSNISVPVPSLDAQRWFDSVQNKAASIRAHHAVASSDLDTLLPALLAEAFVEASPSTTPAR